MKKYLAALFVSICCFSTVVFAVEAPLYFGDEKYPVKQNTLLLDSDDTTGDILIQFGNALNKIFQWDNDATDIGGDATGMFVMQEGLELYENTAGVGAGTGLTIGQAGAGDSILQFLLSGVRRWVIGIDNSDNDSFKIAATADLASDTALVITTSKEVLLNAPATAPADATFANSQWSLWLDETNDQFRLKAKKSNGTVLNETLTSTLAALQTRRTTTLALVTGNWTNIPFDQTDVETNAAVIQHNDTNTDRIDIKATGYYAISAQLAANDSATSHRVNIRVQKNGTTTLNGSSVYNYDYQNEYIHSGPDFIAYLTAGDYIVLQAQASTSTNQGLLGETVMRVIMLNGVKGDKGDQGLPGSAGAGTDSATFTLDQDNAGAGANVSIVAEQGSDLNGALRYNATTNLWEMSNDGGGYTPLGGWLGSQTRIKLLPTDFISDDNDDNVVIAANGSYVSDSSGTADAAVNVAIPIGFRATHVMVYGNTAANTIAVYANSIADGTTATSLGTGNVGTELNITDLDSSATNYLSIYVNTGTNNQIYGGYVTIAAIP